MRRQGLAALGFNVDKESDDAGLMFKYYQCGGGKDGVIGAGQLAHGLVAPTSVKEVIVSRPGATQALYLFTFGDSPLDIPMLIEANEAVLAVGNEQQRSRSMDAALINLSPLTATRTPPAASATGTSNLAFVRTRSVLNAVYFLPLPATSARSLMPCLSPGFKGPHNPA